MEFQYKDLLLNIFIVLLPLLMIKPIIQRKNRYLPLFVFVLFFLPTMLTMLFPVKVFETTFDFRAVPIVLGSFYGGPLTATLMFISLLFFRALIDEINIFHYFLGLLPTFILIQIILRKGRYLTFTQKIIAVMSTILIMRVSVVQIYYSLEGFENTFNNILLPSLPIILVQSILACFCCYIIESIRNNYKLTEEIIRTEKMKTVSDFAASVAHEVRNPLTTVKGFIQLLGNNDLSEDKRQSYRELCLEELNRAEQIISDYLAMAKPEQETIEQINLKNEFSYISSLLGSYANLKSVQINMDVPDDISLLGNNSKFRQAIINIGKNAIEAMPKGGLLQFKVKMVNKMIEIVIEDTGMGMNADQVRRLGTPYYSTKEKGTGLGTMVMFNIIRQMGGKVDVESDVGVGTKFIISLPLQSS